MTPGANHESCNHAAGPIRVAIANDHAIVRAGLRTLLEGESDFRVIAEAGSGAEAVTIVSSRKPDVLLLDAALPCGVSSDALERLRGYPACRVILLATSIDTDALMRALRLGVRGVVLRDTATELLFKSIRTVMRGEYWIGRAAVAELVRLLMDAPAPRVHPVSQDFGLTDRERQIVELIVAGHSNREISQRLTVTLDTVKHHLTSIFDKTGASTRLELALFALHGQLVDDSVFT